MIKHMLYIPMLIMMTSCGQNIVSLETNEVYKTQKLGFSQANMFNGLLFTSGQVGWDKEFNLIGEGSFEEQLKQTFINLDKILQEGNSSFDNVILIRIYVKELDKAKRIEIGRMINKYYPNTYRPNSTLIGIANLAREDLLVEMEIIAKTIK